MNTKRIIFYLVILLISFVIFARYTPKKEAKLQVEEPITFPPKEVLDALEKLQIQ